MAVSFVNSFSLDYGKMDYPIQIATISMRMGLSSVCFRGSQVDFPNIYVQCTSVYENCFYHSKQCKPL